MVRCAVFSCNSHNKRIVSNQREPQAKISFFRFPKNQDLAKLWRSLCCRSDPFILENARICDKHFVPGDYVNKPIKDLDFSKGYRRIKNEAIPSINLPVGNVLSEHMAISCTQVKIPDFSTIVEELIAESPDETMNPNLPDDNEMINEPKSECQNTVCAERILSLELELKILKREIDELRQFKQIILNKQNKQPNENSTDIVVKTEPFDKVFESLESMQEAFLLKPIPF